MAFWVLYDHIGALILLNLLALVAVLLPAWMLTKLVPGWRPWLSVLVAALTASATIAGEANLMVALLAHKEFSFRHVIRGIALYGVQAVALLGLYAVAGLIGGVGTWFYANTVMPARPIAGLLLAGVCLSPAVLLALFGVYLLPALVHQHGSIWQAVRVSAMLAGRHPVLTAGLVAVAAIYGIVLVTPPGMLLLSVLPLVALSCGAYELLARHYAAEEALERGEVPAAASGGEMLDENEIFLNRGFSDFLFPWKS